MPANFTTALIPQFAHDSRIGSYAVGDDGLGPTMPLQRLLQEAQSCGFALFLGDVGLQDFAFMVNGAPQVRRRRMIRGIIPRPSHSPLILATPPFASRTSRRHATATAGTPAFGSPAGEECPLRTADRTGSTTIAPSRGRCRLRAQSAGPRRCAATAEHGRIASSPAASPRARSGNTGTGWLVFGSGTCPCPTPNAATSPSGALPLTAPCHPVEAHRRIAAGGLNQRLIFQP